MLGTPATSKQGARVSRYSRRAAHCGGVDVTGKRMYKISALFGIVLACGGCTVLSVAGTAVSTTASVAGTVVSTGVSVAGSAVKGVANAVSGSSDKD